MTAFVALGNWPDGVHVAIRTVHEHAYYKWASAARLTRSAKCPNCSGLVLAGVEVRYRGLAFCTASCLADFQRDVERSHPVMPS